MLRNVALCVLALLVGGCGSGGEDRAELQKYVDQMQQLDALNQQVASFIMRLDQPSFEITEGDLAEARALVKRYVEQVQSIASVDIAYRELRVTHDLYGRKLAEALNLVEDTGRELRRERGNVAIGMRHIEKMTQQHYKALDVLWLRTDQESDFPLEWPE